MRRDQIINSRRGNVKRQEGNTEGLYPGRPLTQQWEDLLHQNRAETARSKFGIILNKVFVPIVKARVEQIFNIVLHNHYLYICV